MKPPKPLAEIERCSLCDNTGTMNIEVLYGAGIYAIERSMCPCLAIDRICKVYDNYMLEFRIWSKSLQFRYGDVMNRNFKVS